MTSTLRTYSPLRTALFGIAFFANLVIAFYYTFTVPSLLAALWWITTIGWLLAIGRERRLRSTV